MNLNGKYIEINKNNAEYIIKFLYSNGHEWTIGTNLIDTLNNYKEFIDVNKVSYIRIDYNQFIFLNYKPDDRYTYFNINKLIREKKLKRILK